MEWPCQFPTLPVCIAAQVSRVMPGQRMGKDGLPMSNVTVEDLLRMLINLQPHESTVVALEEVRV